MRCRQKNDERPVLGEFDWHRLVSKAVPYIDSRLVGTLNPILQHAKIIEVEKFFNFPKTLSAFLKIKQCER